MKPKKIYEFGPFRLCPPERTLVRSEEPVNLTPKVFELLVLLVESRGELLDKEVLLDRLWPDTVVEESNLSVNISTLRQALGESPSQPAYIETVPKRGYRFIAPVREVTEAEKPPPIPVVEPRLRFAAWGAAAFVGIALLAVLAWSWPTMPVESPWQPAPLTSLPGMEETPALSPDGSHVLFVRGGAEKGIWLQPVGAVEPVRLTREMDRNPAWSPDGKEIAFVRLKGRNRVSLITRPPLGGPERVLAELVTFPSWPGPFISYSPDGRHLWASTASENAGSQRLVAIARQSGEQSLLPVMPPRSSAFGDTAPAVSPSGNQLAFARCGTMATCDVYLVALNGIEPRGEPKRISFLPSYLLRPAFAPDGSLVYAIGAPDVRAIEHTRFDWLGRPHSTRRSGFGEEAVFPSLAVNRANGRTRLVYVRSNSDVNIWRLDMAAPDGAFVHSERLIASTRHDETPAYSPDGKRIAFASARSGEWAIWVCEAAGNECFQLSHLGPAYTRTPRWSPDGKWIVFDSRQDGNADLYVIPSEGGREKRLTFEASSEIDPSWSPDGKWIYFGSNRTGRFEVYRMQANAGSPTEALTQTGALLPRLSPDGDWLYYRDDTGNVFRKHTGSGALERLAAPFPINTYTPGPGSILYAILGSPGQLSRLDWRTGKQEGLRPLEPYRPGFSRSPDGKHLLFAQADRNDSDLMIVEDFR